MKKNTVIASIVLLLVSFLFLGITQKDVSADMLSSGVITGYNSVAFMSSDGVTTYYTGWVPRGSFYYLQPPAVPEGCLGWYFDGDTTQPFKTGFTLTENVTVIAVPRPEGVDIKDYMYGKSGLLVVDASNDKQPVALTDSTHPTQKNRAQAIKISEITDPVNWSFKLVNDENGAPKCRQATVTGSDCYYYVKSSNEKYLDLSGNKVQFSDSPVEVFVGLLSHNVEGGSADSFVLMPAEGSNGRVNLSGNNSANGFQIYNGGTFTNQGENFYVYPYVEAEKFKVTFETNGGSEPAPGQDPVPVYTDITLPNYTGTKDGKAFAGWTLDRYATSKNGNYDPGKTYKVSGNVTFYAVYSDLAKITLDPGVGGWVAETSITAVKGSTIDLTKSQYIPVNGKHTFEGWGEGTGVNFNSTAKLVNQTAYKVPNGNRTLYAVWDEAYYVYFNFNGSDKQPTEGVAVEPGEKPAFPTEFGTLHGHTFKGWSYFNSGASIYFTADGKDSNDNDFEMPRRDVTLYAVWQPNTVTVTYQEMGAAQTVEPSTGEPGTSITLKIPTAREGYTFLGWADSPDSVVPAYTVDKEYTLPAKDKVLYAVWQPNQVTVTFDKNGGTGSNRPETKPYNSEEKITIPSIETLGWTRDGYSFLGWSTDKNSVQADRFDTEINVPKRDLTIYAVWQKNTITITFHSNGGSVDAPSSISKSKDESFIAPEYNGTNKNNNVFIGWGTTKSAVTYKDGETYKMPLVDTTLYAIWKNTVTLTFDVQYNLKYGKSIDDTLKKSNQKPRDSLTLETGSLWDLTGKNGDLQFLGWKNEQANETYAIGTPFSIPDQDTTLIAQWEGNPTVCFYWNDGRKNDGTCQSASIGQVVNFPDVSTYSGSKNPGSLIGWMDRASNQGESGYHKVYQVNENYTVIPKSVQSFYAVWNESYTDALKFGIRLDGNIPEEPGTYPTTEYTTKYASQGGNVFAYKALNKQQWVVDTSYNIREIEEKNLWYAPNAVTANIAEDAIPSADEVRMMMEAAGKSFNPEKQFVLWYVIKWQNNTSPYTFWHVDGVVLNRAPYVGISYHQNLPNGNVSNMPIGFQVLEGTYVRVGAESKNGNVKEPYSPGYSFLGWSTTPDGEVEFRGGERYELTQNLDLYAIWDMNSVTIQVTKEWHETVGENEKQSVSVKLKADGSYKNISLTLGSNNGWSASVSVPKYNDDGEQINYSWEEVIPTNARFVQKEGGYNDDALMDASGNVLCAAGFGCNVTITNTRKILPLTITAADLEWTYDGESHDGNNPPNGKDGQPIAKYSITSGALEPGHEITVTLKGSVKDVADGTMSNEIDSIVIKDSAGLEVTDWYKITPVSGTLKINPAPVTVTAPVLTKVYGQDNSAAVPVEPGKLTAKTIVGLVTGETEAAIPHVMSYETEKDVLRTYSGTTYTDTPYPITFTVGDRRITEPMMEPIIQGNYAVTYIPGSLTITPKQVTVTAVAASKIYGDDDRTWSATVSGTLEGESVDYTITRSETDHENTGRVRQGDDSYSDPVPHDDVIIPSGDAHQGGQYNSNYDVEYIPADLTITPRPLTITANSGEKKYDGKPLTANVNETDGKQYTVNETKTGTGLAFKDSLSGVTVDGSAIFVTNPAVPSKASGGVLTSETGADVTANYDITYVDGALTVNQRYLAFRANDGQKVYDGTPLRVNEYTLGKLIENSNEKTGNTLADGDKLSAYKIDGEQLVVGEHINEAVRNSVRITRDGTDVTSNYNIEYFDGLLKVTGEPAVIIRAASGTWLYDGAAHSDDGYTVEGLMGEDSIAELTVSGEQLEAGTSPNVPSAVKIVNSAGTNVTSTYGISYENGTLKVIRRPIAIRAASDEKPYDGTSLRNSNYSLESRLEDGSTLAPGQTIQSVKVEGSRISRGISDNTASAVVILDRNRDPVDVEKNYDVQYLIGKLEVKPLPVVVTANNFSKEFGLNDPVFTAVVSGTLPGEEGLISYELTREPGEEPDEYVITAEGAAFQGNYDVTYNPGKLTILWNPTAYSVSKVWADDNNRDGLRPVSLLVTLAGSDGSVRSRRLNEANGWSAVISDLPLYSGGRPISYSWTEENVEGYTGTSVVNANATVFTNTHEIARTSASVTKIWDDKDNAAGSRPASLGVALRGNGTNVLGISLNEENNWSTTVSNLPMNENGRTIEYIWYERTVSGGYYAVSSTTSGGNTTLVNSNLYNLTIHYHYVDGSEAHEDYKDRLPAGGTFVIDSPELQGYTASQAAVVGMMPARDLVITVIYTAEGQTVVTPTPIVPTPVPTAQPEQPQENQKEVPQPRTEVVADEEHPVVVPVPTRLVDIDDLRTALGLGEVIISNHGFAIE